MKAKISLLILCALLLSACGTQTAPQATPQPTAIARTTPKPFSPYDLRLYSVDSDAISELGYDADEQVLVARWRNTGIRYAYYDVPEEVYNALMAADSLGSYFYYNVRMSYVYERLD